MMILLNILLILSVFLLTLLLFVLLIPFEYTFSGERYGTYLLEGKISWFFGGLKGRFTMESSKRTSFSLQIFDVPLSSQNHKEEKPKSRKKKASPTKEKRKKTKNFDVRLFLDKKLFEVLCRLAADILKHMKPQAFLLHGSIGFEDPYHTGIFWGGLNVLYPLLKDFDIQIAPVFHEEKFEGKFALGGKIVVGALVLLVIKALLSRPGRNIIIQFIKNKKEEKAYVI